MKHIPVEMLAKYYLTKYYQTLLSKYSSLVTKCCQNLFLEYLSEANFTKLDGIFETLNKNFITFGFENIHDYEQTRLKLNISLSNFAAKIFEILTKFYQTWLLIFLSYCTSIYQARLLKYFKIFITKFN